MPSEHPPAVPYEPARHDADPVFWRLFRLGMILWPAIVLVRHATYWGNRGLADVVASRAVTTAAVESILLVGVLVIASGASGPTRRLLMWLGLLSGALILMGLVNLGLELSDGSARPFLHAIWVAASRLQLLVMPLLAVLAWLRWREN